eukprot:c16645_g1_i1.p1 GENE.c16645_g1_i1~~c16645_g1_i1.p1  ORF type:complete len:739 (-),score=276.62 c16645_g1_i1:38-2254(-)
MQNNYGMNMTQNTSMQNFGSQAYRKQRNQNNQFRYSSPIPSGPVYEQQSNYSSYSPQLQYQGIHQDSNYGNGYQGYSDDGYQGYSGVIEDELEKEEIKIGGSVQFSNPYYQPNIKNISKQSTSSTKAYNNQNHSSAPFTASSGRNRVNHYGSSQGQGQQGQGQQGQQYPQHFRATISPQSNHFVSLNLAEELKQQCLDLTRSLVSEDEIFKRIPFLIRESRLTKIEENDIENERGKYFGGESYFNIYPLKEFPSTSVSQVGVWTQVFKAISRNDLKSYSLTCVFPYVSSSPPIPNPHQPSPYSQSSKLLQTTLPHIDKILKKRLSEISHPSLIKFSRYFLSSDFQNSPKLFMVYHYFPDSESLDRKFNFSTYKYRLSQQQQAGLSPQFVPEDILWSLIVQMIGCLNAIHSANLAHRLVSISNVFVTGKNRFRLANFGFADILGIYDSNDSNSILMAQAQDVFDLGLMILQLGCQSPSANLHLGQSMETMKCRYSLDLCDFVSKLLSKASGVTQYPSACAITISSPLLTSKVWLTLESSLSYSDHVESLLTKELQSPRICRILMKFGIINERSSFDNDPKWKPTGEYYVLKLFRDFVFHQHSLDGHSTLNMAHVISTLNKLDSGSSEKILLMSNDEVTVIIISYSEIRMLFETCLDEMFETQQNQQHQQQNNLNTNLDDLNGNNGIQQKKGFKIRMYQQNMMSTEEISSSVGIMNRNNFQKIDSDHQLNEQFQASLWLR